MHMEGIEKRPEVNHEVFNIKMRTNFKTLLLKCPRPTRGTLLLAMSIKSPMAPPLRTKPWVNLTLLPLAGTPGQLTSRASTGSVSSKSAAVFL